VRRWTDSQQIFETVLADKRIAFEVEERPCHADSGLITDEELERERGGSGLRYSFDIKSGGITQEVGVDAKTGKVLENAKEGPHPH
jgi:hypothetical protein